MSYVALYKGTKPIIRLAAGGGGGTPWVRPAWPVLADLTSTNNIATGIYGVDETDSNLVSVLVVVSTGTWTIDWGDGTTETGLTSNVKRDHAYDYATIGSSPIDGLKPVVVTITTSGGNITTLSLQKKHSLVAGAGAFTVNWLDFSINASQIALFEIGGTVVSMAKLQSCKIYNHSITGMTYLFQDCRLLQNVPLFNTSSVTSMWGMFFNCHSLQTVPLFDTSSLTISRFMFSSCHSLKTVPLFNLSKVTDAQQMFVNCFSLTSVPLFNLEKATNLTEMFRECRSLISVPLFNLNTIDNIIIGFMFYGCTSLETVPLFNTVSATNIGGMFYECKSLKSVPLFNTASVTNMSSMFQECRSLKSVPLFNTSSVTTMSAMFYNCFSLESVPLFNTVNNQSFGFMFAGCSSLQKIPQFISSSVTSSSNVSSFFAQCPSLIKGRTNGIQYSISYSNCKLSAAALDDIFTGLGTASGAQTITIGGNPGAATCDRSIATAKGWTVTG